VLLQVFYILCAYYTDIKEQQTVVQEDAHKQEPFGQAKTMSVVKHYMARCFLWHKVSPGISDVETR